MSLTKATIGRRLQKPAVKSSPTNSESSSVVNAIGHLLSSDELRVQFETSPDQVAQLLNVDEQDLAEFVIIDSQQLRRQAVTLLNKRWHEIRRLVPLTISELGDGADEIFRFYATNDWPVGHRRHPVDALRFLQFLIADRIHQPNMTELKRMRRVGSINV